ncbi:hypothetical protein GZL_07741 [Streptomyces sp. 769]|nr:hypothetical protein GZL_07741 [Streptomyces sp. 769]
MTAVGAPSLPICRTECPGQPGSGRVVRGTRLFAAGKPPPDLRRR